jgi:hypothetical protein
VSPSSIGHRLRATVVLMSLVASCNLNQVEPWSYLCVRFESWLGDLRTTLWTICCLTGGSRNNRGSAVRLARCVSRSGRSEPLARRLDGPSLHSDIYCNHPARVSLGARMLQFLDATKQ